MRRRRNTEERRVVDRAGSRLLLLAAAIGMIWGIGSPGGARAERDGQEIPLDEADLFFERFPEGTYEIEARGLDGEELESEAEVTHLLPAPAAGIRASGEPILPEEVDCDEGPQPLVREPW
jgi:hypothetical protein